MKNSFKTELIFGITFILTFLLIVFVYITTINHNNFLREEGLAYIKKSLKHNQVLMQIQLG